MEMTQENQPPSPPQRRIPPWRWAWIGFAASVVLWMGSSIYFQRIHQFAEIEYQSGGMEEGEYDALTRDYIRYAMICKATSGILFLGSLMYLLSHVDIRSRRPRS